MTAELTSTAALEDQTPAKDDEYETPGDARWSLSREGWENITNPATAETVREAISQWAQGWAWPVSGDLTTKCSAAFEVTHG